MIRTITAADVREVARSIQIEGRPITHEEVVARLVARCPEWSRNAIEAAIESHNEHEEA